MHLAGPTPWIAPLATGHPLGLPAARKQPSQPTKVLPLAHARDPGAALTQGQPPAKFWLLSAGEPDPETHIAPPSIMQIKITQLLDEQASDSETTGNVPETAIEKPGDDREGPQPEVSNYLEAVGGKNRAATDPAPAKDPGDPSPARRGYHESSSILRNSVLSTLP